MGVRLRDAFLCPVLIGREEPCAAMRAMVAAAADGAGGTVLVSGGAGLGKSRLVREVCQTARADGVLVVEGRCAELDFAVPYAVVRDLLGGFVEAHPPAVVAHFLGPFMDHLTGLVPESTGGSHGEDGPEPRAEGPESVPPAERRRGLQRAVVGWMARLAEAQPLVVVLEDLHWSDGASLDAVVALARSAAARRALLVLTFRDEGRSEALSLAIARLERERLAAEVALRPLTEGEVEQMTCAILGVRPPIAPGFVGEVHRLTEGNPFFVEELVRSMAAAGTVSQGAVPRDPRRSGGARVPRTLQETVNHRMRRLRPGTRRMLDVAAVTGRRFDFELLRAVLGTGEDELLDLVREAVFQQLVDEEGPDRFAFRHALTREAVYAALLARERRALHGQLADALEAMHHEGPALDPVLGHHLFEAGSWERALVHCRRAGERAAALPAPREAEVHFTRALEAAARLGAEVDGSVLRSRGLARETLGDFEGARRDLDAALAKACAPEDAQLEMDVLLDLGRLWSARDYGRTGACFERALELARRLDDAPALGRTLNRVGNWRFNRGEFAAAGRLHDEALGLFRRSGDRSGAAHTLDLKALHALAMGQPSTAAACFREAETHFRDLPAPRRLASALAMRTASGPGVFSTVFVPSGSRDAGGADVLEESLRICRRIGWRAGEAYALAMRGSRSLWFGAYGEALGDGRRALAHAEEIEHRQWMSLACVVLGATYLDLLDFDAARAWFVRARGLARELASNIWEAYTSGFLARTLVRLGELDAAREILAEALPPADRPAFVGHRFVVLARAEAELAAGEPARALASVHALIGQAAEPGHPARRRDVPRLALLEARALAALGKHDEAGQVLEAAGDGARALRAWPIAWRCDVEVGRVNTRLRRRARATGAYAKARATLEALADGIPEPTLRNAFTTRVRGLLPGGAQRSRRSDGMRDPLTKRQWEVAVLVARGRSNRDIGHTLGISERTVESHVSDALARLGFRSRSQLAAWVERQRIT